MERERCLCASHPSGRYFVVFSRDGSGDIRQVNNGNEVVEIGTPPGFIPTCIYISQPVDTPFFIVGGAGGTACLFFYSEGIKDIGFKYIQGSCSSPVLSCWTGTIEVKGEISDRPVYMCILGHHNGNLSFYISANLETTLPFEEAFLDSQSHHRIGSPVRMLSHVGEQLVVVRQDKTISLYTIALELRLKPIICSRLIKTIVGPDVFMAGIDVNAARDPRRPLPSLRLIFVFWRSSFAVYAGSDLRLTFAGQVIASSGNICCCTAMLRRDMMSAIVAGAGVRGGLYYAGVDLNMRGDGSTFGRAKKLLETPYKFPSIPCGICSAGGRLLIAPRAGKSVNIQISGIEELKDFADK